jgi:tRNA-binding EMAP/Myf-like protein
VAEIIDINEFAKLDLRIGKIENAERVEVSKKLKHKS